MDRLEARLWPGFVILANRVYDEMARGLDHIVHAVRDLDAATAFYSRLGFQVGSRNRHARTWGTQNHIVQLPGTFIELLSVTDKSGIAPHAPRSFIRRVQP